MTKSPCYNCNKRSVGCHATCSDYLEWKEIHENERQLINEMRKKHDRQILNSCKLGQR